MEKPKAVMGWLKGMNATRGEFVVRIAFPVEDANSLHEWFGGYPKDGDTRWFALAAIDEVAAKAHAIGQVKPKQKVLSEAETAIKGSHALCAEPAFWRFLSETQGAANIASEGDAAVWVRDRTGVETRAEFKTDSMARERWFRIARDYHIWAAQPAEGEDG